MRDEKEEKKKQARSCTSIYNVLYMYMFMLSRLLF